MRKGDIRKQEILQTAETLFCRYGYEKTSIQDILDQLKTSKGSFYHHYPSKEAVLEGICRNRAEQIFHAVEAKLSDQNTAEQKINILLSGMIPFQDEKLSFLLMFLQIFRLPEGRSIKSSYCEALSAQFYQAFRAALEAGHASGELICPQPDIATDICFALVHELWTRICDLMIRCEEEGQEADLSEILRMTEQYRAAVEKILSVRYGAIILIDIPSLRFLNEQIHAHWDINQQQENLIINTINENNEGGPTV